MYILNGKTYEDKEKTITPTSQAFMFGYGLFETIKVLDGNILFLDEHLNRLKNGCKTLNLELNTKESKIKEDSYRLLKLKNIKNGVLKISYAKGKDEFYLVLTTRENSYTRDDYKNGFKLMISDYRRNQNSLLVSVKSNNYMENLILKEQAKDLGFDEVLFLNTDEHISEGASSNIFWIKGKKVYTPSKECGLLPGIVREKVIEACKNLNLKIKIGKFKERDLIDAEEVFITNSVMDLMPVCQIKDKIFDIEKNITTKDILKEYRKLIGDGYER